MLAYAFVLLALLDAQDPLPSAPPSPAVPFRLEDHMAREAAPAPVQEVNGVKGAFRARVPAGVKAPPTVADGLQYFVLDAGTSSPIECFVFDAEKDPAASVRELAESTLAALAKQQGPIARRSVHSTDAGALGNHPFLAVSWLYRVESKEGARVGMLKQRLAALPGHTVYCHNADVGYERTFVRVFDALVQSLEFQDRAASPYYSEVARVSLGERAIGFSRVSFQEDEDGDTRVVDQTSMMLPVSADQLHVSDTYRIQFSRPDGTLINERAVESEQGVVVSNLALDPVEGGGWRVGGTVQGKPLEARLEAQTLQSDLGQMLAIRRFLATARPGAALQFKDWTDEVPDRLVDTEVKVEDVRPEGIAAGVSMAGLKLAAIYDRSGSMTSARMTMGAHAMDFRRVSVQGSVPAPKPAATSLYLSEIPVTASLTLPADPGAILRLALQVRDPASFAELLPAAAKARVSAGQVTFELAPDLTAPGSVDPGHARPSFVVDFEEPAVRVVAERHGLAASSSVEDLVAAAASAIPAKTYGWGWLVASQAALRGEGDCTEHAVLLAALARLTGRPARVVLGIVLVGDEDAKTRAFGHAWTELGEAGRWRRADATPVGGTAGARYLPLAAMKDEGVGFTLPLVTFLQSAWPTRIDG